VARALEGEQTSTARAELNATFTGPLTTMATHERIDPIKRTRPNYAGPRNAPAWWTATEDDDNDDDLVGSLIT